MRPTGYVYDERYLLHDPGSWHPERPDRLKAIQRALKDSGVLELLVPIQPYPAPLSWVERLHDPDYIRRFKKACEKGRQILDTQDCGISPQSYDIALLAAGGVMAAADAVMGGQVDNAFCAVRPPGHHAERDRAMGFCFFNNVALGALYLLENFGLERVAIVDWDVHHGNGTQHSFYSDPSVYYSSAHQYPFYPGTGDETETGTGAGLGTTLNFPLPPGSDDDDYLELVENWLIPAMFRFKPDLILLSAGFDAHKDDPLANMLLSTECYGKMTRLILSAAREICQGRLVSLLEGGYNHDALSDSVLCHIKELLG